MRATRRIARQSQALRWNFFNSPTATYPFLYHTLLTIFKPADSLIVPDVLYKLTHHFAELEGKAIGNQPWMDQGYYIGKAMQMIDFTLGRTGVVLKSDATIVIPPLGIDTELRRFDFNRPFLIYIKKRGPDYSPFFVMWVDNTELMKAFGVGN